MINEAFSGELLHTTRALEEVYRGEVFFQLLNRIKSEDKKTKERKKVKKKTEVKTFSLAIKPVCREGHLRAGAQQFFWPGTEQERRGAAMQHSTEQTKAGPGQAGGVDERGRMEETYEPGPACLTPEDSGLMQHSWAWEACIPAAYLSRVSGPVNA